MQMLHTLFLILTQLPFIECHHNLNTIIGILYLNHFFLYKIYLFESISLFFKGGDLR